MLRKIRSTGSDDPGIDCAQLVNSLENAPEILSDAQYYINDMSFANYSAILLFLRPEEEMAREYILAIQSDESEIGGFWYVNVPYFL